MNHLARRVRVTTVGISLVALTLTTLGGAVEQANATSSSTRCKNDSIAVRAFARQQVNNAAARTVPYSSISSFPTIAASAKDKIAQTSGNTGGRARDIFLDRASVQDRKNMVEEFLRATLASEIAAFRQAVTTQAEGVYAAVASSFGTNYPVVANAKGNASISKRLPMTSQSITRSGSFSLRHRTLLGLSSTKVGRFSYSIRLRNRPTIKPIRYKISYNTCDGTTRSGEVQYQTEITTNPVMEVRYQFTKIRNNMCEDQECQAFSGTFKVFSDDDKITKTLEESRAL